MKALITAAFDEQALSLLRPCLEVTHESYRKTGKIYHDADEFIEKIRKEYAEVLVVEADLVHEEVFEACPLRVVGCCRGDPLNVSREAASLRGVPILYTPGRNAESVADLTIGFMLCLARNILPVNLGLRSGKIRFESTRDILQAFDQYGGFELGGCTIGLVGLGRVGRRVAERLRPFGPRILGYDPAVPEEAFQEIGVDPVSLPVLLESADIVSLHAALTPQTQRMIDEKALSRMKPTAYLVNTARSFLMDEKALLAALREGRLRGAALDVFDEEPIDSENPFLKLDNVLCTPHLGGATRDVVKRQSEMIAQDLLRYLNGERPHHVWNPEVLPPL